MRHRPLHVPAKNETQTHMGKGGGKWPLPACFNKPSLEGMPAHIVLAAQSTLPANFSKPASSQRQQPPPQSRPCWQHLRVCVGVRTVFVHAQATSNSSNTVTDCHKEQCNRTVVRPQVTDPGDRSLFPMMTRRRVSVTSWCKPASNQSELQIQQ